MGSVDAGEGRCYEPVSEAIGRERVRREDQGLGAGGGREERVAVAVTAGRGGSWAGAKRRAASVVRLVCLLASLARSRAVLRRDATDGWPMHYC